MKLSEMTTDRMMDVLAVITPEIGQIIQDKELIATFLTKKAADESTMEFGINRIVSMVPQICIKHKKPVYKILSALTGKTDKEIADQSGMQTIKEIKEAFSDPDLISFFSSSKPLEQK